jgi:hypothetical protein
LDYDLVITNGTTFDGLQVTYSYLGTGINLSGVTGTDLRLQARATPTGTPIIDLWVGSGITITWPFLGIWQIDSGIFTGITTGVYPYAVDLKLSTSVRTYLSGTIRILPDWVHA